MSSQKRNMEKRYYIHKEECWKCGKWSSMLLGKCNFCGTEHGDPRSLFKKERYAYNLPRKQIEKRRGVIPSPKRKLNETQAKEIKSLYEAGGESYRSLSKRFKISYTTISDIVKNKIYKEFNNK